MPDPSVSAPGLEAVAPDLLADAVHVARGPTLLEAAADAPARLDVGWMPEAVAAPRARVGAGFWLATGLCTLVASWVVLSMVSFLLGLFRQSQGLGVLSAVVTFAGAAMIAYAVLLEVRAYRSLGTVERLRAVLAAGDTTVAVARGHALTWLAQVGAALPDRAVVGRML